MQIPYHIKVSLQEYYELFQSGKWNIPDYSSNCAICGGSNCATYHGHYERSAIWPDSDFYVTDLPVIRYLCHEKGIKKNCDHVTFSLLPLVLIPYRRLPIHFMVLALWIRLQGHLGQVKALATIEKELVVFRDYAFFVNISAQMEWARLIKGALSLILTGKAKITFSPQLEPIRSSRNNKEKLLTFLEIAMSYESRYLDPAIRGPDALGWDFYQLHGGPEQLAPFLFGTASQHRF